MYIIGLCGQSGSGKSTVAAFLRSRGVYIIDADKVCRQVYATDRACIKELCDRFGGDILVGGSIHRPTLASKAFGAKDGVADLNRIAHKYISMEIMTHLEKARGRGVNYALLDAPLLFEAGLEKICHGILVTVADKKRQISRLKGRDGKNEKELEKRLAAQKSASELVAVADAVIVNNGTIKQLRQSTYRAMLLIQLKLGAVKYGGGKRYVCKKL